MKIYQFCVGTWEIIGIIVVFCACEFATKPPTLEKLIVGILAGPFAINKKWWNL
jgi:hypothetical protein